MISRSHPPYPTWPLLPRLDTCTQCVLVGGLCFIGHHLDYFGYGDPSEQEKRTGAIDWIRERTIASLPLWASFFCCLGIAGFIAYGAAWSVEVLGLESVEDGSVGSVANGSGDPSPTVGGKSKLEFWIGWSWVPAAALCLVCFCLCCTCGRHSKWADLLQWDGFSGVRDATDYLADHSVDLSDVYPWVTKDLSGWVVDAFQLDGRPGSQKCVRIMCICMRTFLSTIALVFLIPWWVVLFICRRLNTFHMCIRPLNWELEEAASASSSSSTEVPAQQDVKNVILGCLRGILCGCCLGSRCLVRRLRSILSGGWPIGTRVEITSGENQGRCGEIWENDGTSTPYKVRFKDGSITPSWIARDDVRKLSGSADGGVWAAFCCCCLGCRSLVRRTKSVSCISCEDLPRAFAGACACCFCLLCVGGLPVGIFFTLRAIDDWEFDMPPPPPAVPGLPLAPPSAPQEPPESLSLWLLAGGWLFAFIISACAARQALLTSCVGGRPLYGTAIVFVFVVALAAMVAWAMALAPLYNTVDAPSAAPWCAGLGRCYDEQAPNSRLYFIVWSTCLAASAVACCTNRCLSWQKKMVTADPEKLVALATIRAKPDELDIRLPAAGAVRDALEQMPTSVAQQLTHEQSRCHMFAELGADEDLKDMSLWRIHEAGWTVLLKLLPGGAGEQSSNLKALSSAACAVTFGVVKKQPSSRLSAPRARSPYVKKSSQREPADISARSNIASTADEMPSTPPSPPPSPPMHVINVGDPPMLVKAVTLSTVDARDLKGDVKKRWPLLMRQAREGFSPLLKTFTMLPDLELGFLPTLSPCVEFAGLYREWFAAVQIIEEVVKKKTYGTEEAEADARQYFSSYAAYLNAKAFDSSRLHGTQPFVLQLTLEGLCTQDKTGKGFLAKIGFAKYDETDTPRQRARTLAAAVLKLVTAPTQGRSLTFKPEDSSQFTFTFVKEEFVDKAKVFVNPMVFGPNDELDNKLRKENHAEFSKDDLSTLMGANLSFLIQDGSCRPSPRIILTGEAPNGIHSNLLGEYKLRDERVNGRVSYEKVGASYHMIWFTSTQWIVGSSGDKGENRGWLTATTPVPLPELIACVWDAYDGGDTKTWIKAPKLLVRRASTALVPMGKTSCGRFVSMYTETQPDGSINANYRVANFIDGEFRPVHNPEKLGRGVLIQGPDHCVAPEWLGKFHSFKYDATTDVWQETTLESTNGAFTPWNRVGSVLPSAGDIFSTGEPPFTKHYRVDNPASLTIDDLATLTTLLSLCPPIDLLDLRNVRPSWLVQLNPLVRKVESTPRRIICRPNSSTGLKATLIELGKHWASNSQTVFDLEGEKFQLVVEARNRSHPKEPGLRESPLAFTVQTGEVALAKALLAARGATERDRFLVDAHGTTAQLCAWRLPKPPTDAPGERHYPHCEREGPASRLALLKSFVTALPLEARTFKENTALEGALVLDAGSGDCTLHAFVMHPGSKDQMEATFDTGPFGMGLLRNGGRMMISSVDDGGQAERQGVLVGSLILKIGHKEVPEFKDKDDVEKVKQQLRDAKRPVTVVLAVPNVANSEPLPSMSRHELAKDKWTPSPIGQAGIRYETPAESAKVAEAMSKVVAERAKVAAQNAKFAPHDLQMVKEEDDHEDAELNRLQQEAENVKNKVERDAIERAKDEQQSHRQWCDKFADKVKIELPKLLTKHNINFKHVILSPTAWYRDLGQADRSLADEMLHTLRQALLAALGTAVTAFDYKYDSKGRIDALTSEFEGLYEYSAVRYAVATAMPKAQPFICVVAGGNGSVQVSGADTSFSLESNLRSAEAKIEAVKVSEERRRVQVERWQSEVAMTFNNNPATDLKFFYHEVAVAAKREEERLRVLCIGSFWYGAHALGLVKSESGKLSTLAMVVSATKLLEAIRTHIDDSESTSKNVANLARLETTLKMLFGGGNLDNVEVLFARDWTLDGKEFRSTWSTGWALCKFGMMPTFENAKKGKDAKSLAVESVARRIWTYPIAEAHLGPGHRIDFTDKFRTDKGFLAAPSPLPPPLPPSSSPMVPSPSIEKVGFDGYATVTANEGKPRPYVQAVEVRFDGSAASAKVDIKLTRHRDRAGNLTLRCAEAFHYARGTKLLVLAPSSGGKVRLVDGTVDRWAGFEQALLEKGNRHTVNIPDANSAGGSWTVPIEVDLNELNHCPAVLDMKTYEKTRQRYCRACILHPLEYLEDAITTKKLHIKMQLQDIETTGSHINLKNVAQLAGKIIGQHQAAKRLMGIMAQQAILLSAGAGTGKTWSMQQLAYTLAEELAEESEGPQLVPIVLYCQKLVKLWSPAQDTSLLVQYIRSEFQDPEMVAMLLQAHDMRTLVVLLDGIDEAAGLKQEIQDFVLQVR